MSFYIATIKEIDGDKEYTSDVLFESDDPKDKADKIAANWRGAFDPEWDEVYGGYWDDGALIKCTHYVEIPKEDFDVLKKYLAVL